MTAIHLKAVGQSASIEFTEEGSQVTGDTDIVRLVNHWLRQPMSEPPPLLPKGPEPENFWWVHVHLYELLRDRFGRSFSISSEDAPEKPWDEHVVA